ncbi:MAG: hypothetical protein H6662_18315 [Ardenticatenaceae bacterium]|nr:hypothetical protein [Anaerolineales bacterium]MCB8923546.1 hypothetical protein [Ardenticatenaceae bacterium]MCB8991883.1 hypothetical protein [Ardenticatenaceae bacterium]MCB9003729.1 hypothetical protein [Ardenticatenaceae bacterium]
MQKFFFILATLLLITLTATSCGVETPPQPTATATRTTASTAISTTIPPTTAAAETAVPPTTPPLPTETTPPTATAVAEETAVATPPITAPVNAIIVDHTSVALFEQIPEEYLQAAAALHMLFIDRSVGANISDGLSCLAFDSDEAAPSHCKRYTHTVPAYSSDPSEVNWARSGGYNRDNWSYDFWEEGGGCNQWYDKVGCFINMMATRINQYDVVSFQLSYLAVEETSDILAQPGGFFADNADRYDVYDLAAYEAQYPDKVFIYWTTSLARGIGSQIATDFNDQMRQYAIANSKPLFDVADILSHAPDGSPCYDNRDGIAYDNGNNSENYADDGINQLAICPHYTTETDGGHLGSVSVGKIRVAKAFWVLMAEIAGWQPNGD